MGWRRWRTCCGRSTCDTTRRSRLGRARPVHPLLRHASMLLYSLLHLTGFDVSLDDLKEFRQWGSRTRAPEAGHTPGVEVTTGPLGQGFGNAVGMAMASRMLAQRFNRPGHEIVSHRIWRSARRRPDGGVSSERRLWPIPPAREPRGVLRRQPDHIEGSTDLAFRETWGPVSRLRLECADRRGRQHGPRRDGSGDRRSVHATERPTLVIVRTSIGYGSPTSRTPPARTERRWGGRGRSREGTPRVPAPPLPRADDVLAHFGGARARGAGEKAWRVKFAAYAAVPALALEWSGGCGHLPEGWAEGIPTFPPEAARRRPGARPARC